MRVSDLGHPGKKGKYINEGRFKSFERCVGVALSAGIVVAGAGAVSLAAVTVAEAAVINRIDVRGNSRVDASTVRGNLTITPGTRFNNNDVDESVKRLFPQVFSPMFASVCPDQL
jgi:outer membrane protein assembly factor BamA